MPQRWLWVPRTRPIRFIEIHAVRGDTTPALQKQSALNWVQSPLNKQDGWGSSFSHVIGTDGSQGTVLDDNQQPTYSAGFGGPNSTYAIDWYGISYELAQSPAQEPFSDAIYDRLAKEVAVDCLRYGIPPVMIAVFDQSGAVPTGIVRHDRCQNGRILGKTDPGDQFDEARFIRQLKAEMQEGDDMATSELASVLRTIQRKKGRGDLLTTDEQALFDNLVALMPHIAPAYIELVLGRQSGQKGQRAAWAQMVQHPHADSGGGTSEARMREIAQEEDRKLRVTKL
jgi:hypothetical protein